MARFIAGMFCGALLLFAVMHYHVVRGDRGVVLVPKISNNFTDVYTDVRDFDLQDWKSHKPLAAAIMHSSREDLLDDAAQRSVGNTVKRMVDDLFSRR